MVAHVVDSTSVSLSYLVCIDGENWDFSKPYIIKPENSFEIEYLSWNQAGTDLAIIDSFGNLSIYSSSNTALGKYNCNFTTALPTTNELNSIVGFKWLENEKPVIILNPATIAPGFEQLSKALTSNQSNIAEYKYFQAKPYGPYVPLAPKHGCIALTRRGVLKLFTQNLSDSNFVEVSQSLNEDGEIFSHAGFAGMKDDSLIITAYSSLTETLYVYKVMVDWPILSKRPNANQVANVQVSRVLRTKITIPTSEKYVLSQMLVLPAGVHSMETENDAEIYVVFSSLNSTRSIIQKLGILLKPVNLHNNFYSLASSRRDSYTNANDQQPQSSLISHEKHQYEKRIVCLSSLNYDSFVAIGFSDATVELKHRVQFASPSKPQTISSPTLIGYNLEPATMPITHFAISHTMASGVYLNHEGKLVISYMRSTKVLQVGQPRSNAIMLASAICMALRYAASCFSSAAGDDILVVVKREIKKWESISPEYCEIFERIVLREAYKAVSFNLDVSKDSPVDKIIVNPSLQRLLSMQVVLGTSLGWKRNVMARVAWCMLNLRILAFAFTFTLRAVNQQSSNPDPNFKPGYFMSMTGLSRWCIDLMAYICQELYMSTLQSDYFNEKASVPAAIMLGKVPRMFLIYSLRGIRGMEQIAQKLSEQEKNSYNGPAHVASRKLKEITHHFSPVPIDVFERMATDLDNTLNSIYPNLDSRTQVEHDIIFNAQIPKDLLAVMKRTVDIFNSHLKPKINVASLYYYEVSWLKLNDNMVPSHSDDLKIDYLRKQEIMADHNGTWCRCSRCGEFSIWHNPKTQTSAYWTIACQKNCICNGAWVNIDGVEN